jgi:hypothetical protein
MSESQLDLAPLGSGIDVDDHAVPFQLIASACFAPSSGVLLPTAMQVLVAGHATPSSELTLAPGGTGISRLDHAVPSQAAA